MIVPEYLPKARAQGLIPHFSRTALALREQGIYFSEGLVHRIAARLGESNWLHQTKGQNASDAPR